VTSLTGHRSPISLASDTAALRVFSRWARFGVCVAYPAPDAAKTGRFCRNAAIRAKHSGTVLFDENGGSHKQESRPRPGGRGG
jgi:hypothetical protein